MYNTSYPFKGTVFKSIVFSLVTYTKAPTQKIEGFSTL